MQIEFGADNAPINENKRSLLCSATVTSETSITRAIDAFIAGMLDWTANNEEEERVHSSITVK